MERFIDAAPGVRLWTEDRGATDASPLLLIMGAQAPGLGWPDELVDMLTSRHRVIRYDHRDTGRSTWAFDQRPYPLNQLAEDALTVLDGLGVERAHIVGMSLGGMLAQLLIADHPDRLLSATLIGTRALSTVPYVQPDGSRVSPEELPGIAPRLRILGGNQLPFDAEYARALERKVMEHTGHYATSTAHARADASNLDRTEQLAQTTVPTLVTSAPAEPVSPPPHPHHLAQAIQGARIIEIPGMGHALPREVHTPLVAAILDHTTRR